MAKLTTNICATLYDGKIEFTFDCVGTDKCKFVLCDIMPPPEDAVCFYCRHNGCNHISAKVEALEKMKRLITKNIAELSEDND